MTGFLGIDHPLVVVRDLEAMRQRYTALGFRMTNPSKHPWGTSTSVAVFRKCLLELMSIYDETLIDEKPAGDFRFGRFVRDDLDEREGISLLALHSEDAEADAELVKARGIECQGTIEFGRDIVLPDGSRDRTSTTLKILASETLPRLSNFACHQHRPDLIEVPQWMDHPNGCVGISNVSILAERRDHALVRDRLVGLYGAAAVSSTDAGLSAVTGNGSFTVIDRAQAAEVYGDLPQDLLADTRPCYFAIDVTTPDLSRALAFVVQANVAHRSFQDRILLSDAGHFGNVFLSFVKA